MCKTEPEAAKSKPLSEEELLAKRRAIEERVAAARKLQAEATLQPAGAAASTSEAGPSTNGAAPRAAGAPAARTADGAQGCALPGGYEAGETVYHIGEAISVENFPDLEHGSGLTRTPRGLGGTYRLRGSAPRALYAPEAQGGVPRLATYCPCWVRLRASGPPYSPRTVVITAGTARWARSSG